MSLFYVLAGVNHFIHPAVYERIMPSYLSGHQSLIIISGCCEIVLGLLLLWQRSRHMAAWGIILLLLVIFPANIQMAINYYHRNDPYLWIALLRLPIQPLLIWWAYQYTPPKQR